MKKILFICSLLALTATTIHAQGNVKIGLSGGLLNVNTDVKIDVPIIGNIANFDAINETGFYIGGLVDIEVTPKIHVQPELLYGSAGDLSFVYLPLMAKYYVAGKLNIQVGPQFTFSSNVDEIKQVIELIDSDLDDVVKSTGIDLGIGAGYDVTNKIAIQARYSFELTNRYSGPASSALLIRPNNLFVGAVFTF